MALSSLSVSELAARWVTPELPAPADQQEPKAVDAAVTHRRRLLRRTKTLPRTAVRELARVCVIRARDHAIEALEKAGLPDLAGQLRQAVEGDLWVPTEKLYSIVAAEAAEAAAVADSAHQAAAASHQGANRAMDAVPEGITPEMTLRVSGALRAGFEADEASRKAQVLGAATLAFRWPTLRHPS